MARRLPPDPEDMNEERAEWVFIAMEAFAGETGQKFATDGKEEILSDLLANVAHYCDRNGLNYRQLLNRAEMHYDAETNNKGKQFQL